MKNLARRGLSLLLVLVMCLSLLPAIQTPAEAAVQNVTYVTSGTTIKNWGTRGVTATFLSQNADAFYTSNNTSYTALAALAGSSNVDNVPSSSLFSALHALMYDNLDNPTSYDGTKNLYQYTDCENSGDVISSFYSGNSIGPAWGSTPSWNREHTWPNSKSTSGSDSSTARETDIMMLRPTASSENGGRSNTAYGTSTGYYHPNQESDIDDNYDVISTGEYDLRGDVARVVLYVYTCWGTSTQADGCLDYMWGTGGVIESKEVLLDWMEADPVDTWELGRNDSVESITGTRNVFVDYPELAFALFNEDVPANYASPSGGEIDTTAYSATFLQNGITKGASSGTSVTMPAHSGTAPNGYTFIGWVTDTVEDEATLPTYYDVDEVVSLSADTTFYALYSSTTAGSGSGDYVKVTSAPSDWAGDYLIVYEAGNAAFNGSLTTLDAASNFQSVTISNNTIASNATTDAIKFTIAASSTDGKYTIRSASGYYIGRAASSNGLNSSATTQYVNTISFADGSVSVAGEGGNRLQFNKSNGQTRFRYFSSTQQPIALYAKVSSGSVTTYTTSTCAHANTVPLAAVPGDCTTPSYNAGTFCNDCQMVIAGGELVAAPGHKYEGVVTPPTATDEGYTTYTCSVCGDSYEDDYTDPVGETYTVSFSVPAGVTKPADMPCNNTGITLPIPEGEPSGEYTYVFEGWATASVNGVTERPELWSGSYTATSDVTLVAVYSYTVGGTGDSTYRLVTSADQLVEDANVIITAADKDLAMSTQNKNNRAQVSITKNTQDNTLSSYAGATEFKLVAGNVSGTFAFYDATEEGYLYAASSGSNYLRTEGTLSDNSSWLITFEEGVTKVVAQGANTRNWMRYNSSSGLFACYSEGQADISLYVSTASGGTVYYSSVFAAGEEPEEVTYTVSFRVPNHAGIVTPAAMVGGESGITLPTPNAPAGYTFVGWAESEVPQTTTAPALVPTTYIPTADTTLYAVYSYSVAASGEPTYDLVSGSLTEGDYVIVYSGKAMKASVTNGRLDYSEVTVTGNRVASPAADIIWHIAPVDNGQYYTIYNAGTESYAAGTGVKNKAQLLAEINDYAKWTVSGTSTYEFVNLGNENDGVNKNLRNNGTYGFACYATSTGGALSLYKATAPSTTYYTSDIDLGAVEDGTLKFKGVNLTLKDSQYLNFNALQSVVDQYENVYAVLEADGKQIAVVTDSFTHTDKDGNVRYNYSFQDLTVLDFGLEVKATLYGTKDGTLYCSPTVSYTLLQYCTNAIANKNSNDSVPCAYLLKYVQAAEAYKNVDAADRIAVPSDLDSLLNANIEAAAPSQTVTVNNGQQVTFKGQHLQMEAKLNLEVKVLLKDTDVDTSKVTLTVAYKDVYNENVTKEYAFADLVASTDANVYLLAIKDLYASQMGETVTVTIAIDGAVESTLQTSIESYCTAIASGDNYSASMKELAKRIFLYGEAVEATYAS